MFRPGSVSGDVWQIHFGLLTGRQLNLRLFRGFLETLHGKRIARKSNASIFLELISQEVDQTQIKVFTTQECVAISGQHFELLLAINVGNFDDRHVEGTTAEVIHGNLAILAISLVHAISERRRSRLIDNALHFQTSNTACILGGLTLGVIKIGRHGNHRLGDFLTEVVLSGFFHLFQHLS